jgi:hypothetical protein
LHADAVLRWSPAVAPATAADDSVRASVEKLLAYAQPAAAAGAVPRVFGDAAMALREVGAQVAAACVAVDRLEDAQSLLARCWALFGEQWAALHPLARQARGGALQRARELAELDEFVSAALAARTGDTAPLRRVTVRWPQRFPSRVHDGVDVWDELALLRRVCAAALPRIVGGLMQVFHNTTGFLFPRRLIDWRCVQVDGSERLTEKEVAQFDLRLTHETRLALVDAAVKQGSTEVRLGLRIYDIYAEQPLCAYATQRIPHMCCGCFTHRVVFGRLRAMSSRQPVRTTRA